MKNNTLTLDQVKHNFNVGDVVTVTSDRDSYDDADLVAYQEQKIDKVAIQKALKGMIDHLILLNEGETFSSSTLMTMAIDALCEDEEYCDLIDRKSAEAYLQKIADALELKGLTFYDINILECEICSQCGVVLLPDDECYQDHESGLALCSACSIQCRGCGNAIASSKVVGCTEYYCEVCAAKFNDIPMLHSMNFEQFENFVGDFTFQTGIKPAIGQGYCASNGVVHCKVEGAYEWFFANRKDAFERIVKQNRDVPYAYLELNGFSIESLLSCIQTIKSCSTNPQTKCFNANEYTTRDLLEREFQNVPNGARKENLIAEALQLVEECAYTVGEAANEVLCDLNNPVETTSFTGLPLLSSIKEHFLTFVGEWANGKECRTGENRADGTVSYNQDGLYLYEFQTREDAFKYLFEDDRSVPYAMAEYYQEASEYNGEETFDELKYFNGFNPSWIDSERALQLKVASF